MNRNYKEVDLINTMLRLLPKQHETVKDLMIYERGYLTGLLASLAHDDSYIRSILIKRINDLSKKY
jgi:hypothetical protein